MQSREEGCYLWMRGDNKAGALSGEVSDRLCCAQEEWLLTSECSEGDGELGEWLRPVQPTGVSSTGLPYCLCGNGSLLKFPRSGTQWRVLSASTGPESVFITLVVSGDHRVLGFLIML